MFFTFPTILLIISKMNFFLTPVDAFECNEKVFKK